MLPQYILEVQLNIRKRIQDNEYQNVLAEICLQVKWCSKAQNTCSTVLSPLSFFVASYLNAALFFVFWNSFTVILNLWRVFSHIIRTAISTFYCIISPLPRKLGINRAVGTSRSRYRAYRRHQCRRYGVREDLCSHHKKVQMKRSVTGGETKAAAHKGKALVLRWLGARQRLYLLRWIRMESTLICSFSESLACNLPKGSV